MGISCGDYGDTDRVDAATLPPFDNNSRCSACGNRRGIRVHYSPGSREIRGPHFKRLCLCGTQWPERAVSVASPVS